MIIALVTDSHCGVRNDSQSFAKYQKKFWDEVFYPKIDELGIKTVIHLGDIVDRRKYINFLTARNLRNDVINPAMDRGLDFHVILGNHDVFHKSSNDINVMDEVFGQSKHPNLNWYVGPKEMKFDDLGILFMPWINNGNYQECLEAMKTSTSDVMMGHFEISGFEMYKGTVSDHGMNIDLFSKFDHIMSGHFHHKSRNRNIDYLGAPFEMTWSDYNDPRGFHLYDTSTRELTFIENPHKMFVKVYYDDLNKTMDEATKVPEGLNEAYVKVFVKNKINPYWFDKFMDGIEKSECLNVQIIENGVSIILEDEEIAEEAADTATIIKNYVQALELEESETKALLQIMDSLYHEALNME